MPLNARQDLASLGMVVQGFAIDLDRLRTCCRDPRARRAMKRYFHFLWPAVGITAVVFSFWLLYREVRGLTAGDVVSSLKSISARQYLLAGAATLVAYAALAWYDRIALLHIGRKLSWVFISLTSFTTYALSHNIGMSVLSGAMVRYRAYRTKGLAVGEIAVLVAFCSFTFVLGTILLSGIVLVLEPKIMLRLFAIPTWIARLLGAGLLALVAAYAAGSLLHFRPLTLGGFRMVYPRPHIMARQLAAGPLELIGAAGIIYFSLPASANPGFLVVLGVFLASFSAALLSYAPGGIGVLEIVFLKGMPDAPISKVLAALIVFRLFYLVVPLLIGLVVVLLFERGRLPQVLPGTPLPRSDESVADAPPNVAGVEPRQE